MAMALCTQEHSSNTHLRLGELLPLPLVSVWLARQMQLTLVNNDLAVKEPAYVQQQQQQQQQSVPSDHIVFPESSDRALHEAVAHLLLRDGPGGTVIVHLHVPQYADLMLRFLHATHVWLSQRANDDHHAVQHLEQQQQQQPGCAEEPEAKRATNFAGVAADTLTSPPAIVWPEIPQVHTPRRMEEPLSPLVSAMRHIRRTGGLLHYSFAELTELAGMATEAMTPVARRVMGSHVHTPIPFYVDIPDPILRLTGLSAAFCREANVRLLFHTPGIPPREVLGSGGLDMRYSKVGSFGRGLYFTDSPLKAMSYFRPEWGMQPDAKHPDCHYLMIVLVALGRSYVLPAGEADQALYREPPGFDSVIGTPRDQPEYVIYDSRRALVSLVVYYRPGAPVPAPQPVAAGVLIPSALKAFFVELIARAESAGAGMPIRIVIADLLKGKIDPPAFVDRISDMLNAPPPADLIENLTLHLTRVRRGARPPPPPPPPPKHPTIPDLINSPAPVSSLAPLSLPPLLSTSHTSSSGQAADATDAVDGSESSSSAASPLTAAPSPNVSGAETKEVIVVSEPTISGTDSSSASAPAPTPTPTPSHPCLSRRATVILPRSLKIFFDACKQRLAEAHQRARFDHLVYQLVGRKMSVEAFLQDIGQSLGGEPPAGLLSDLREQLTRASFAENSQPSLATKDRPSRP